jgi:hypothetical protein
MRRSYHRYWCALKYVAELSADDVLHASNLDCHQIVERLAVNHGHPDSRSQTEGGDV